MSVAATTTLGATIPADGDAAAEISIVTVAGGSVTIPVVEAAGLPADLSTFTVTTAGAGTLASAGGRVTYTAPASLPETMLTGPARDAASLPPAIINRQARPPLVSTSPAGGDPTEPTTPSSPEVPSPPEVSAAPAPPAGPTPDAAPPTPTPTPATPTQDATPPHGDPDSAPGNTGSTATPAPEVNTTEPAAPLLGTGVDAPPASDRITYTVCTSDRSACTNGTVTVAFAPSLLHLVSAQTVTAEQGQQLTLDPKTVIEHSYTANLDSVIAEPQRGTVRIRGGAISYTAPSTAGADTVQITLCSLGDDSACVTGTISVTVAPAFTTDDTTDVAITTDRNGVATFPVPSRSDSGPLNPATITVTQQPEHATVTANRQRFTLQLIDPTTIGTEGFTWRACAAANSSNCRSSHVHLTVNDGFGWTTTERRVIAGLTTTLDVPPIAADATRWGLNVASINVTGPDDITVTQASPGQYRIGTPATRHDPFTLRICGEGRNGVEMCGTVRYLVTALNVVAPRGDPPRDLLTGQHQQAAPVTPANTQTMPVSQAPAPSQQQQQQQPGGVDVTWWVIGAAMLFGIGGGAGALRNRH